MKKLIQSVVLALVIAALQWLTVPAVWGQSDMLQSLEQGLEHYAAHHFQEKLFVHTDRSFYMTGETVWFRIYVTDGYEHKPANLSKVAYMELIDKDSSAVVQAKILVENGEGEGTMVLPATMASGTYLLRAYTNWMKNFSADYFFHKAVTVVNGNWKLGLTSSADEEAYDIGFFPEGGNLVAGLPSRVGFKVTDKAGKGIPYQGFLLGRNNDTLLKFQPLRFGMGSFVFTPDSVTHYRAGIVTASGKTFYQDLPHVYPSGHVLKVEEEGGRLKVEIRSSHKAVAEPVYLITHTRQVIKVAEYAMLREGSATIMIDKRRLGEGISHITLFNHSKQPLCERLYFRYPEKSLSIKVTQEQGVYDTRGKVSLSLAVEDEQKQPASASMSLSVCLLDSLESFGDETIHGYLWLASDLRGFIESPSYYFMNKGAEAARALDDLLLTQGWSRFRWEDVLSSADASLEFLPEYEGHLIRGKVTHIAPDAPAKGVLACVSSPGKPGHFAAARSNDTGEVFFLVKNLSGEADVIAQIVSEKDTACKIQIGSPFTGKMPGFMIPACDFSFAMRHSLLLRHVNANVKEAFGSKKTMQYAPVKNIFPVYGSAEKTYFLDDYTRFPTMEEVMREYVREVLVRKRKDGFHFMVLDRPRDLVFENDPLVLLDGVPVSDIDKLMAFDPKKLERLDVVARGYFAGPLFASGIVSFSTYKGDLAGFEIDPRTLVIAYEGLQLRKEFYAPRYESEEQRKSRIPDFRNLLYWTPAIRSGASGSLDVSFYTSDAEGRYAVIVHGLSPDGKAGSGFSTFEVRRSSK